MKRNGLMIILFLSTILFFVSSCGRNNADNASNEDQMNSGNNTSMNDQTTIHQNQFWISDRDYTFDQRNDFRDDVNAAIDRLNNKINTLEEKASNTAGDIKEWYNDRISELKDQRAEIQKDMQNFRSVTADKWNDFKADISSAWNDIEDSYNKMVQDDRMKVDQRY